MTHVLVDTWYSAKALWRAARERGFLITSGLQANRALRVPDPDAPTGWRWQRLDEYAAGRRAADYTAVTWPSQAGGRTVYAHVVQTRVRKLYRRQVLLVRESLDALLTPARSWASRELASDRPTPVGHAAARREVEVLFGDAKGLLGLDRDQPLSATAPVRCWTLVLAAHACIEEEQARLRRDEGGPVTIGDARAALQRPHQRHLLCWLHAPFQAGATPHELAERLAARRYPGNVHG